MAFAQWTKLGGASGVSTAPGDPLIVTAQKATDVPITIKGASAQSGVLLDVRNSSNSQLAFVGNVGQIWTQSAVYGGGNGGTTINLDPQGNPAVIFGSTKTVLSATANNTLGLQNGTSAQALQVYNTWSSGYANYELGTFDFTTSSNVLSIGTQSLGTGLARPLQLVTGGTRAIYIDTSQRVGIGTSSPSSQLALAGNVTAASWTTTGIAASVAAATYTDSTTAVSGTVTTRAVTSLAQPTLAASNTGVTISNAATLYIAGQPTAGTNVTINNNYAVLVASGNAYFAGAVITGNNVVVNGSTSTLGYGTGAGGAVTQTTSRTTGVTLNKSTGTITLVSAAGSASWQSFTLTNSQIAANDVVKVSQKSGTDLYNIIVTNTGAGSCVISFQTTGGTTTEQPVFNFVVIKGSAS